MNNLNIDKRIKKVIKKIRNKKTRSVTSIKEISYEKLKKLIKETTNITIVDVRSPQEFSEGRISNAINIPLYDLNKKAEILLSNKEELIVLYCTCGIRSKKAYEILEEKGYTNIYSLIGGIDNII